MYYGRIAALIGGFALRQMFTNHVFCYYYCTCSVFCWLNEWYVTWLVWLLAPLSPYRVCASDECPGQHAVWRPAPPRHAPAGWTVSHQLHVPPSHGRHAPPQSPPQGRARSRTPRKSAASRIPTRTRTKFWDRLIKKLIRARRNEVRIVVTGGATIRRSTVIAFQSVSRASIYENKFCG